MIQDTLTQARSMFGVTYAIARASALVLHVDIALLTGLYQVPDQPELLQKQRIVGAMRRSLEQQFGKAKLPVGTRLRLVSQEGAMVKVNYLNQIVAIPATAE